MGKGWRCRWVLVVRLAVGGCVGSCLRRNDGEWRGGDGERVGVGGGVGVTGGGGVDDWGAVWAVVVARGLSPPT